MNQVTIDKAEQLQEAFRLFNQASEQLASSYQELEDQVTMLNGELASAHSERLIQLIEKEKLAMRLQRILEVLPAGVLVIDEYGKVTECNGQAKSLLGEDIHESIWREIKTREFVHWTGDGQEVSLRNGKKVNVVVRNMQSEPGQIILLSDVTEIRALQEAVHRQRRLSAVGEVVSRIAHQIRTPLSSTMLYASQLKRQNLTDHQREKFVNKLIHGLEHLENTVNEIMVYVRGKQDSHVEIFQTKPLVAELHQLIEPQLEQKGCELWLDDKSNSVSLRGNRQVLLSALLNLFQNALDADASHISFTLKCDEHNLQLRVFDNGKGMDSETVGQIFNPFYTTRSNGTGLGLAVVKTVISSMGGQIFVQSKPNVGTEFYIEIPLNEKSSVLPSGTSIIDFGKQNHGKAEYAMAVGSNQEL